MVINSINSFVEYSHNNSVTANLTNTLFSYINQSNFINSTVLFIYSMLYTSDVSIQYELNTETYFINTNYFYKYNILIYIYLYTLLYLSITESSIISKYVTTVLENNLNGFLDLFKLFSCLLFAMFIEIFIINNAIKLNFIAVNTTTIVLFLALFLINVFYNFGIHSFIYIKGIFYTKYTILLHINDLIATMAFICRVLLQFVRICLVLLNLAILSKYLFISVDLFISNHIQFIITHSAFSNIILHILISIIDTLDSIMTIFTQFGVFFIIILWLFSYLFTTINSKVEYVNYNL